MKGVGNFSLGHAWLRSWKLVHTRMISYFLLHGIGLETHDVYAMGYRKLIDHNLSISALIYMDFEG